MKHPRNTRNIIFLLSIVSLIVAFCLYAYMYQVSNELVDSTISARKIVKDSQTNLVQGKEIIKLHESTAAKRERLSSFFVPAENAVAAIQAIESIGDSSGASVTISSIKTSAPSDTKERIGQVTASVVISGSWGDVMQALELFETLQYQNDIKNVSLNYAGQADGSSGGGRNWQSNFDISVATIQKI
ncbi:MAG: hypothetical protein NT077_04295 [Candidatus Taylorbacteria bacterium]|nr:hypothetical protein [Candidatus Taylorbacteria bacterium]